MAKSELIENGALRRIFRKAPKSEFIAFRLSKADKTSIRSAAKSVNVSITGYLLNLHRFAVSPAIKTRPTVVGEGTG